MTIYLYLLFVRLVGTVAGLQRRPAVDVEWLATVEPSVNTRTGMTTHGCADKKLLALPTATTALVTRPLQQRLQPTQLLMPVMSPSKYFSFNVQPVSFSYYILRFNIQSVYPYLP